MQDREWKKDAESIRSPPEVQHERPYLWVKSIDAFLDDPEKLAAGVVVQLVIENVGNVTALNVTAVSRISVTDMKFRDKTPPNITEVRKPTPQFLPPKQPLVHILPDTDGMPFDETLIPLIEKKEAFLYVFGEAHYEDESKRSYSCNYSFVYEPKPKRFAVTSFHNECD